jgi:uncharacterized cupin superfamily protein
MPEAKLTATEDGVVPEGEGWFVLNARDARWMHTDSLGSCVTFEGEPRFAQLGLNVNVLRKGEGGAMYHGELRQEGFLVLAGEGVAIVEGQERPLKAWDFLHCPPWTAHTLVATSDEPFVYVAIGARGEEKGIVYPVNEVAQRHGFGVERETKVPAEAYEGKGEISRGPYREGDLPELT